MPAFHAPAPSPAAGTSESVRTEPELLRRRAPARVEITDASGRPLRMTRRFVHVRAGQQLRVRVVPQAPTDGGPKPTAKVRPSDALYPVVDEHPVAGGAVDAVLAQYQVRQRGKVPVPKRATLHVTVTVPGSEAFTLAIPLAVWPSWWLLLSAGFVTVAGPLVSARFFELAKALDAFRAAQQIVTNTQFVSTTSLFAVLAAGGLKLLGWVAVWTGIITGDAE